VRGEAGQIAIRGKGGAAASFFSPGQTVDFFLSRNRDVNAAKSFLRSAMKNTRVPTKVTLDAYAAPHRAGGRCRKKANFRVASRFDPAST